MDWTSVTFDWNRARAFLVTAEEGSLSAAARALGLAQPTLGRQVDALEKELGVALFERFGRGLQLTPAGYELLAHARAMGEAAQGLSRVAFGQSGTMEGAVTISASDLYCGLLLPPVLKRLHAEVPRITVTLVAENTASDLMRREADIAIRNFRPKEPDLIARKLREAAARFYGTPACLGRFGPLRAPGDLARAEVIAPGDPATFIAHFGQIGLTPANFPFRCANYLAAWAMVKEDLGIALVDERVGDADGDVVRALPDYVPVTFPVWLVVHRDLHRNRRLRFVYDFLADALG